MLKVVKSLPAKCDNCGKLKEPKAYHRYPNGRRHRNCIACEEAKAERARKAQVLENTSGIRTCWIGGCYPTLRNQHEDCT